MISTEIIAQTPEVKILLTVGNGVKSQTLFFGLDPSATDGIDTALGELELPPLPPSEVFDARFLLPPNQQIASLSDYRFGYDTTKGDRSYRVNYQIGTGSGVTMGWNLPTGVTGILKDLFGGIIVDKPIHGTGSYIIPNSAISSLDIIITYSEKITNVESLNKLLPKKFCLYQNYPNPFNPSTTIKYGLPENARVKLVIYNLLGEYVEEILNKEQRAGYHKVIWNADKYASGVYIYRIEAGEYSNAKRLILIK